jgi:peptidoglycan/LPS O-acetylase OafA/YrhL
MGLLRVILALSVVITHSAPIFGFKFVGGIVAVQTFYIISGFYMALILSEKYIGKNNSYKLFITNRLLRLYPIHWTVLFLTIIVSLTVALKNHGHNFGKLQIYIDYFHSMSIGSFIFLVFSNIALFFQDVVMFFGLNTSTGFLFFTPAFANTNPLLWHFSLVPQAWSIGVELTFYLIAPFLIKIKTRILIFIGLLSLMLRFIIYFLIGWLNDPWTYRFFPTELMFFLAGIIAYRVYKYIEKGNSIFGIKFKIQKQILNAILIFVLILSIFFDFIPINFYIKYCLYFIFVFMALPFIFLLTKNWKWDRYIGELSYPIYISHMLVLICLSAIKFPVIGGIGFELSICTIIFAMMLNKFITNKIEKIRQKRIT